jgi:hypothetical protein
VSGLEVIGVNSVNALPPAVWDSLVAGGVPFLRHGFLSALEDSGCLGDASGWIPCHLVARAGGLPVGLAPVFLKTHSMGEFVYDWAWADAASRSGIRYYPKLVVAAPYSPVTGRRLFGDDPVRRALLAAVVAQARAMDCAGVHLLFCTPEEVALACELGFTHRLGHQFHWSNPGYRDFEDFLGRFDSKRRNQIRRERRRVREQGVELSSHVGDGVEDRFIAPAFAFYGATVDRYVWGRRYLNQRFFELLWARQRAHLQLVLASRAGQVVGGSLNFEARLGGGLRRFGRYWGALDEVDQLHFEVCSYFAIEDAIARGVEVFEAGAGGEQHKLVRGFLPTATHSAHLLFDPRLHDAVTDFCAREAQHVALEIERLTEGVFAR